jgi:phage gpG-like protein
MSTIALQGADAVAARLAGAAQGLPQRMSAVMARLGVGLQAAVADNLDGRVLQRRSGRLAASQEIVLEGDGGTASVAVGFDPGAVPYGAIQEFGGTTRAHLIAAKAAFALSFSVAGTLVFARRVHHPGSVIPARSYLGSALAAVAPAAIATTATAASDGMRR